MLDKAVSKIKAEMEQNASSTYIKVVGNFLLQHLEAHPESAEKIVVEGKTIKDSLAEMRKVAEKQKDGNVAVLTDQEGFQVVLKYFEIDGTQESAAPAGKPAATKSNVDFDVRLEDLL